VDAVAEVELGQDARAGLAIVPLTSVLEGLADAIETGAWDSWQVRRRKLWRRFRFSLFP
jgi:hypothetical protein